MSPLRKKSELTKVFRASFVTSSGVLCFKDPRESTSMVKARRVEEGGPSLRSRRRGLELARCLLGVCCSPGASPR